ncbi:phosphatidylserine decarboxylase family protein [Egibacter rhizosphaerae]|uniref:Phosphatidylserine decarboxylase family protein n=1 Tax=Egibacter rhizosphaerae TaxID=1670831 RepID=A0A411YGA2_9ACTN|nr:phosphatidylserine decarboxylase [Egibacter rhizosphaerae]QBI20112.1 phosphatidylserine decarboxylase family protein [Egibacter rhizosphaerae]
MSRRTWPLACRYAVPALAAGALLVRSGRRVGWPLVGLAAGVMAFFRDPARPLPREPGVAYAASDGFVAAVDHHVEEPWLPEGRATRITVFLSLTDVHVNRSPLPGRVQRMERLGAGFAPALLRRAQDNHRNRLLLEGPGEPVVLVQVAGAIARTISCWVRTGDELAAGQRVGLIHFGSRTDVLLPAGTADVLVSPGDRVRAGVTRLARLKDR